MTAFATQPLILLVDGHSLAFRSFFAFAKGRDGGLKTSTGIPTSVCFGFLKSLLEVMGTQQPQAVAIAFDLGLPTFRHEADDTYKADRAETPEDFVTDLKNLHELLDALNLAVVTAPGYEADDVLGTLTRTASDAGYRVKILTGDRDLFQLVDDVKDISVLYLGNTFWQRNSNVGSQEFYSEQVKAKLGITPSQVVDYKALCGDTSDNIPGVKGIGDKTAVKLLNDYGSLSEIYAALDQIKGAVQKKLEQGKEAADHSQHLARIITNVPLEIDLADCLLRGFDQQALEPLLQKLELRSFANKLQPLQQALGGTESSPVEDTQSWSTPTVEDEDLWFFTAEQTEQLQDQPTTQIQPQVIDTPEKLQALIEQLQSCVSTETPVAWDTETDDLNPRQAKLVGIGCCWGTAPDQVAYIPTGHHTGKNLEVQQVIEALRPILEGEAYPKVFQNTKFDRLILRHQGIHLAGVVFDTMLASYVLNSDTSHSLGDIALRELGVTINSYSQVVPKGKNIADLSPQAIADYCGTQVHITFQLVEKLREKLQAETRLLDLLLKIEQPLEPVLAEMEYLGIQIDVDYLKNLSQKLEQDLAALEEKAYNLAGEKFNLGSPKQLSQLLFEKLQLDPRKSRKIATGYSTDAATLEKLQGDHPVVDTILEYRTLAKLKSTYVDALPAIAVPATQRVHSNFNQTGTVTGRLSSSNPNLQNIPIRTAFNRQIRKAFIPEPGWFMVSADYSQIELRILTHLSQEPVLVEAYNQGQDVHRVTAQLLFDTEEVTPEQRRLGKTINFGVIYGMGAARFAREAGVKSSEGKIFIERFNQRYPKVFAYLEQMKRKAICQGYVTTICDRRRYFNFEGSSLRKLKGQAPQQIDLESLPKKLSQNDATTLRQAANAPIQGSSADIIKMAMVKLHHLLQPYQARLLLQVHDELVFEVPSREWDELYPKIQATMEQAVQLSVPLKVEIHAGQNWMDTK